jgi:heptosyltransferase III
MEGKATPRILVIRGGAIGDFVLTLPAIRLLRENIAGCHLEVLGYPGIVDLAVTAGLADAVRSLEHRTMAPLFAKGATIDESLCDYLCSFNLVVSYLYDPDGFLRDNMERIGVRTFIEASHRVTEGRGHAAEQLAKPLEKIALFLDDPAPNLAVRESACGETEPMIAIHPGSGSVRKSWPVGNWINLGRQLASTYPCARLTLITGEAEQDRGITAEITRAWSDLKFLHFDSLPLPDLARQLAECRAFIGHDSGISHLAAACGVPCLLFFGPTDPHTWAPKNVGVTVHQAREGDLSALALDEAWIAVRAFLDGKIF